MDVQRLKELECELEAYLHRFDDCFGRCDTRAHMGRYVRGQLADLDAKSVEPIALHSGVPVRTLQEFLAQHRWDEDAVRQRVAEIVREEHAGPNSVGIIDETSDVKKGDKTPGVQRQWCGKVGKRENCMVTVHLAFARENFHCLLDGELFLPESWSEDRTRCRQAGIPDEMVYRPKWQIALELYDRARSAGVGLDWITADEGYGSKPGFLEALEARGQKFVVEVPRNFSVWIDSPEVTHRSYRKSGGGRPRKTPRVKSGQDEPRSVENVFFSEAMTRKRWTKYYIKDGEKGPVVWEAKRLRVTLKGSDGMPGMRLWLVVARNVLDGEMKYFVSNAGRATPLQTKLLVGFSRWRVERSFEEEKQEIGLDCFEGRRYVGLKRHLIISSISHLFLVRVREGERKKKSGGHVGTDPRRDRHDRAELVPPGRSQGNPLQARERANQLQSASQCAGTPKSYEDADRQAPLTEY